MPGDIARSFRWIAGLDVRVRSSAQRKESKFECHSNDLHAGQCGLPASPSVCWPRRVSLRSSARSRPRTQVFQTSVRRPSREQLLAASSTRKLAARKRAPPKRGRLSTAETGRGAAIAGSSNRCGKSSVQATSADKTLSPSGSREVLRVEHLAAQSPLVPQRKGTMKSQSAFATAQRRSLTRQVPERGNWATG